MVIDLADDARQIASMAGIDDPRRRDDEWQLFMARSRELHGDKPFPWRPQWFAWCKKYWRIGDKIVDGALPLRREFDAFDPRADRFSPSRLVMTQEEIASRVKAWRNG
jgi:hypothetical protein